MHPALTTEENVRYFEQNLPDERWQANFVAFLRLFEPWLLWRAFTRIPRRPVQTGPKGKLISLTRLVSGPAYPFHSPYHERMLKLLALRHGDRVALTFRLFCRNDWVEMAELEGVIPWPKVMQAIDQGVLLRHDDHVALPFTVYPVGDHFYLSESWQLLDYRRAGHVQPAHVNNQLHSQVNSIRRFIKARSFNPGHPPRVLELGCGIGWVSLELERHLPGHYEGGDLCERSLAFAQANARLRGSSARYYQSNLFASTEGRYDLILFYPYQPTNHTNAMRLIQRFLREAPDHLTETGAIFLRLETLHMRGWAATLQELGRDLRKAGFSAGVAYQRTYNTTNQMPCKGQALFSEVDVWIERGTGGLRPTYQPRLDLQWAMPRLKSGLRALRGAMPSAPGRAPHVCAECGFHICPFGEQPGLAPSPAMIRARLQEAEPAV